MTLQEIKSALESLEDELTPKGYKKSGMDLLKRINNKLIHEISEGRIEASEMTELYETVEDAYTSLEVYIHSRMEMKDEYKDYKKLLNGLVSSVKEKYGWDAEGSISGQYLALGLVFGSAFGSIMIAVGNPAFMAIGTGFGLSIGVAIGASKEKEAKEAGKLY